MLVDTRKADHRKLRLTTVDELLGEIDRIVAAEKAGKLRRTGNWTTGQIFGHLASWMNFAYEGFPPRSKPPFFIRWLLKKKKLQYIRDGMPRGVKIPGVPGGTHATGDLTTEEGARRLRTVLQRMKNREPVKFHSPAFGEMEHDERIAFQLRHAECHLGYLHPS